MKPIFRLVLGAVLFLVGVSAAQAQQSLTPTAVSLSPASGLPGDQVTITVNVANSALSDFSGTAGFSVKFTNLVTGSFFTLVTSADISPVGGLVSKAVQDPTTLQTTPGAGSFSFSGTIPTRTTQAGGYSATVTLTSISGGGGVVGSSFSVSTAALTVTGRPDLAITRLDYAAGTSYVGGQTIAMSLDYVNRTSTNGTNNVPYVPGVNGFPGFVRIQVVLSSNPTFGDADDFQLTIQNISSLKDADGAPSTLNWTQILPGNFAGSYYVLAKIDSLNGLSQNDPGVLTENGNNVWGGNSLNPSGTLINLLPSNFPTSYLSSHQSGLTTSAHGYSDNPSISSDGRYVAFASDAIDLISSDTNAARDIFLFDSQTSLVRRLSVSQQGSQGNGASNNPAVSANGRYVAFASDANNLVIGDTNGFSDIYVVDVVTGLITRVSGANAAGGQANNPSFRPSISQTGRYLVFESTATNLTATTTATGISHIYLHDRDVSGSGTFDTIGNTSTKLVDADATTPATVAANASAIQATISSDGAWIAFASKATNLVAPGTTGARQHVYMRPRANVGTATSGTKLASVVTGTGAEGDADSQTPSLSSDGHYIAYASLATNLLGAGVDTNGVSDIFVYDSTQSVATPTVRRVSVVNGTGAQGTDPSSAGFKLGSINPTISADGRYVAFASLDNNLTSGDINGQSQPADANNALDVFVHDRDAAATGTYDTGAITTTMVSVNPFGYQTNGLLGQPSTAASNIYPVISANGRYVAFPSDAENNAGLAFGATNLLPLDSNGLRDVFLFDRRTNATVTPATPPTVTITSPGTGSSSLVNTAITLTASATTTVGVVSGVQFFVNGTSISSTSVFPYTATWTPTAVGSYTLSALVTDSFGNLGVSPNVSVNINATPSVGLTGPLAGTSITAGTNVSVTATAGASNPGGTITSVQFFVNGVSIGTDSTAPFAVSWTPAVSGAYTLTAVATETIGTQTTQSTSSPVAVTVVISAGSGPAVAITNPVAGTTYVVGNAIPFVATASGGNGPIAQVQFFVNDTALSIDNSSPYSGTWTPLSPGTYSLVAVATDSAGVSSNSPALSIVVGGNAPPSVAIISPAGGSTVVAGAIVNLAATATDADGTVASVRFIANGNTVGTANSSPFSVAWTPTASGTYSVTAQATDNSGNVTNSAAISVSVTGNQAPLVALTTPANGSVFRVGSGTTVTATASDPDGTIASVQFFANGTPIAPAVTSLPYRAPWTPSAEGIYRITAVAVDNAGAATTSSTLAVLAVSSASGGADTIYTGDYSGSGEIGRFAAITVRGKTAAFIGYSTTSVAKTYFYPGLPVDGSGGFSAVDAQGRTLISGNANETGMSGGLDSGRIILIGINAGLFPATRSVASGYYTGNLTGRADSQLAAIVGADGSITLYVADGTFQTAGAGAVDGAGIFTVNTASGARFSGKADPATGFLTGTLSGPNGGSFTAATASGVSFSDGFLRNLSTRGQVGTGSNILIAGFVVGGTTAKQVLIRAIGPTLTSFGITGALADPQLQIFNSSSALVVANNNWGGAGAVINASSQVGAFPLAAGSLDAVVLASLAPGAYTAQVSGVSNGTGVALVELYDIDNLTPFSPQKVMNVATRGVVGTGQNQLIAGFVVSGNTPKKVLVRAVGPTLAAAPFNVGGVLADPVLRIVRADNVVVRENDNWESGNDSSLINDASTRVGAFPLAAGSKDAAILINLPPGTYNAQVAGSGTTTGVALIEVYEVP